MPRGISELEVAGFTPLKSHKIKAVGVNECPVNLEAKVVDKLNISNSTLFVTKIVGASVSKEAILADMAHPFQPGVLLTDLLFEVSINGNPPRLNYTRMNIDNIIPTQSDLGDANQWIGTYTSWIKSELDRGRINQEEYEKLIELNSKWLINPNSENNHEVCQELTALLKDMVWRNISSR